MLACENCSYYDYGLGGQYCDKVGGKNLLFGYCEDAYLEMPKQINQSKQKRKSKRERDQKYKDHLKFLSKNVQCYPPPAIYTNKIYVKGNGLEENPRPYYKRCYRSNHKSNRYTLYKRYANKCVRKYKGEIHNKGNQYRKIFDYCWNVD